MHRKRINKLCIIASCIGLAFYCVGTICYHKFHKVAKVEIPTETTIETEDDLHLIDMSEVESFIVNGNNLYLNFKDGTGYYLESKQIDSRGVPVETTRTENAILVGMENGNYILQTEDGHLWEISDAPEVFYQITFDTNGTDDVEDDIIVGIE